MGTDAFGSSERREIIALSGTGELTVPKWLCEAAGVAEEAECFIRNNEIIIRPIKTNVEDYMEVLLIKDLRDSGLRDEKLSEEYMRLRAAFYDAVHKLIAYGISAFESGETAGTEELLKNGRSGKCRVALTRSAERYLTEADEKIKAALTAAVAELSRDPRRGTPARKLLMGFYVYTVKCGGKRFDIFYQISGGKSRSAAVITAFSAEELYNDIKKLMDKNKS